MSERPRLHLRLSRSCDPTVAVRIQFATRVFAAVWGAALVDIDQADVVLQYGSDEPGDHPPDDDRILGLPASYTVRGPSLPAPPPTWHDEMPCFHPVTPGAGPDHLGELFEWLSGDHERSATTSDAVGRIPFEETLHGAHGLDPRVPWADRVVRALADRIRQHLPRFPDMPASPAAPPPLALTHDLDFLAGHGRSIGRFAKNLARGVRERDPSLTTAVLAAGARAARHGRNPLDTIPVMLAMEAEAGVRSTMNVLCRRAHPRDASYELTRASTHRTLDRLVDAGAEIGLHGSYTSLDSPGRLAEEYDALARAGHPATGGRQHWLRYRDRRLFDELVRAGATYDSSVGYARQPGFRAGASFPYPVWDFAEERPFPVLELPLVLMDVSLEAVPDPHDAIHSVLAAATGLVGGSAVVWHDTTLTGAQIRRGLGEQYPTVLAHPATWLPAREVVDRFASRYRDVGLL